MGDIIVHPAPMIWLWPYRTKVTLEMGLVVFAIERFYFWCNDDGVFGTGSRLNKCYRFCPPCKPAVFLTSQVFSTLSYAACSVILFEWASNSTRVASAVATLTVYMWLLLHRPHPGFTRLQEFGNCGLLRYRKSLQVLLATPGSLSSALFVFRRDTVAAMSTLHEFYRYIMARVFHTCRCITLVTFMCNMRTAAQFAHT
eukprot:GHVU01127734.1.p1 GENE.GHVU01127734.1~~GHVU01127734.1.p1  ORF type:complete len:199 (-),score=2.52 GHVU01127734.1:863-1459(-)